MTENDAAAPTPLTDAKEWEAVVGVSGASDVVRVVDADFARSLERHLAAVVAERDANGVSCSAAWDRAEQAESERDALKAQIAKSGAELPQEPGVIMDEIETDGKKFNWTLVEKAYYDALRTAATAGFASRDAQIEALKKDAERSHADYKIMNSKIVELQENERAYERIIGPKTYQEVADEIEALRADAESSFANGMHEAIYIVNGLKSPDLKPPYRCSPGYEYFDKAAVAIRAAISKLPQKRIDAAKEPTK